ncbi:MAG: FMN-binding protein [Ruminococcus sp.]|nr:FMN-binding protein [Ruminococcus sp.]
MKDILKPIAVLGAICLIVTALLAFINSVTSPIITAAEQRAAQEARLEVMPEATSFEPLEAELPEGVTEAYLADNGGYVLLLSTKGYGGEIILACGILDGKIVKIKTLSHSETSGIGTKVVASDYGDSYCGTSEEDYESVDTVTGATISSKAYRKALAAAFEAVDRLEKEAM